MGRDGDGLEGSTIPQHAKYRSGVRPRQASDSEGDQMPISLRNAQIRLLSDWIPGQ